MHRSPLRRRPTALSGEIVISRRRTLLVVVVSLLAVALLALLLAWRRPLDAIEPPVRATFAAERVRQGAALAAVGNCQGCHTTPEGPPFAGGVPLPTPFGTIYGSNITPDADTGIGRWSLSAFRRALHEGVGRGGEHLYPAFPYDHFTHLADGDVESLYAYFMTREPVRAAPPANELVFPLQFRPLLAGWKLLFFHAGDSTPTAPTSIPARGDYLIEALGHCSACHSPRNALGAEQRGHDVAFTGGMAEGWYAPAINAKSPSPVPWTVEAMEHYLRAGIASEHAMSGGPMQAVTHELAWADPADVRAIAERVVAMMGEPSQEKQALAAAMRQRASTGPLAAASAPAVAGGEAARVEPDAATLALGESVYVGACSACHDLGRGVSSNAALQLPLAVAVHDPDPRSLLRIVRLGILPGDGEARRFMPAFEGSLSDDHLVALLAYLRRQAATAPAWRDLPQAVAEAREETVAGARRSHGR